MSSSKPSLTLNGCLGSLELNYGNHGNQICTVGNFLEKFACKFCFISYCIMSSNICEPLMLYPCFKLIKQQTEDSQHLIGHRAYHHRRR